jgi:hypothetical protein
VVACDFPLLDRGALEPLLSPATVANLGLAVTAYRHPDDGAPEPLLALWSAHALKRLAQNVAKRRTGPCFTLRQLLDLPQQPKRGKSDKTLIGSTEDSISQLPPRLPALPLMHGQRQRQWAPPSLPLPTARSICCCLRIQTCCSMPTRLSNGGKQSPYNVPGWDEPSKRTSPRGEMLWLAASAA